MRNSNLKIAHGFLTYLHHLEKWKIDPDHQKCFLLCENGNSSKDM